jgi:succinyl-CoA synthetase alpha subunit/citrate synthase
MDARKYVKPKKQLIMQAYDINPLHCFVGTSNLIQIASKDDKVLIMNILGNESRTVTPISHAFSGGNVVAGVQYGRAGKLATPIGDIPVYGRLADAIEKHEFNTGVIYLPPTAVYHAVAELIHYNPKLEKIVIVTEKLSVKDQMQIRAIAQFNKISVFGANSLGVADAWNKVRIGGGLGGDNPEELLKKGSVAIHSNSGNFSTTIATYMKTEGFGTTTIVSSGKDNIIQFSLAEFLYAAENDERTEAVVLYVEPGGFYEKIALDLIQSGDLKFTKPIIVTVTGRWKAKLSRAVGHAGALAGSNDDALSKEKWFDSYFGTDAFDENKPENISKKGIRVTSIQHIPLALKAVYAKLGKQPDFPSEGDLSLKPWYANDMDWNLPDHLKIPLVEAMPPYNQQITQANKALGATYLRQKMRNASGASKMDAKTHISELHNVKVTELSNNPIEENILFAITKQKPKNSDLELINFILNYLSKSPESHFNLVQQAFDAGATPNQALMAPLAMLGQNQRFADAKKYTEKFIGIYSELAVRDVDNQINWEDKTVLINSFFDKKDNGNKTSQTLINVLENYKDKSSVLQLTAHILKHYQLSNPDVFVLSGIIFHLTATSLLKKSISQQTAQNAYEYLSIIAKIFVLTTVEKDNKYISALMQTTDEKILSKSFTETAFKAIFNREAESSELREFSTLVGVTLTNGPGTISAKGAKESVSAKNNIATAFMGFLANTGLAHGGNGFEGIEFLLEAFSEANKQPDIKQLAKTAAINFAKQKKQAKKQGTAYKRIPGINHPVFKGKPVNIDPREKYIYEMFQQDNIRNQFWDFYKELVKQLHQEKITKNVYAVNIDAVIATISLKLLWKAYQNDLVDKNAMQKIGFNIFLLGRTIGVAAEIDDHLNRGLDMDTRTPQSELRFVF